MSGGGSAAPSLAAREILSQNEQECPSPHGGRLALNEWIKELFENADLLRMGHCQRLEDLNLGLGWIYYGLARVLRPSKVVVIGSFRGFVPLMFGKALTDNSEGGEVCFIDPSLVDDFWTSPGAVDKYFADAGVTNIRHVPMTTQEFVESDDYRALGQVGIVFIDGYHSEEQARFDYEAFQNKLSPEGITLFHDSIRIRTSRMYGPDRLYEHRVKRFIDKLRENPRLQIFDLPFGGGVTLVRKVE
jgi:predicted O-methyltransferase YrrM